MTLSRIPPALSLVAVLSLTAGCLKNAPSSEPGPVREEAATPRVAEAPGAAVPSSFSCGNTQTLQFGPDIPPDFSQVSSQVDADCFAWQQFIALNWPSASMDGGVDAGFGTAGDLGAVQWQTWMDVAQVFLPDGGPPPAWGTAPQVDPACLAEAGLTRVEAKGRLALTVASKFAEQFDPNSSAQAFPFSGPAWLGAQNGTNVWYDVRISQPEFDYVVDAGLYNAANQMAQADAGVALVLPQGSFQPNTLGAIETKSAWMEVSTPTDARWNRYKLAPAVVLDPSTQKCRAATVALVGLHIIHATQSQPTLIWSTFEHVDNAPNHNADAGSTQWNFYNSQCQPRTLSVPANCSADGGATQVTVGCTPNTPPPYFIGDGCPAPSAVQVTRLTPIDKTAAEVTATVQQHLRQAYPGSVWENYLLVNTLWSTGPSPSPTKPKKAPLPFAAPTPSGSLPIANTTMETYIQQTADFGQGARASNCIVCHASATIQGPSGIASDFSFIFGLAQGLPPANQAALKSKRVTPAIKAGQLHPPRMRRILQ
ncbi:cytochrome c family protein [Corallococcus sp. bb12-1]|uniref:cytochrome c family protein n=1 Tax=Corallococcus sp. bb12-1 TaxID=2996784 RepID=UPI00227147B2|nr:cytochrome c family protein [Corallococcus sp. bb12-1]MCY1041133.1 cytochrome c family protein [Corallococcus sp. bb12-1]